MKYEIEDIESAYRKYKNHIYYSTSNLFYREKVAEFECSDRNNISNNLGLISERKLKEILVWLNEEELDYGKYINKIGYHAIPKKVRPKSEVVNTNIDITHNTQERESHVERLTYLIDVPIDIHIISTIWVIQNGLAYQDAYQKNNYGNMLGNVKDISSDSLRLFQPYFYNYQKWRDNSITVARNEIKAKHNIAIIGLDVKDFYNSCKINSDYYKIYSKDNRIGDFLFKISEKYYSLLPDYKFEEGITALPIGLLSSAVISNHYLSGFDKLVEKEISPVYYGRYVDDITIVKRVIDSPTSSIDIDRTVNDILNQLFDKNIPEKIIGDHDLKVQEDKITKYYFDATGPTTLLDKFEKEIRQNSSEFRFLPDMNDKDSDFLDSAYAINYTGSKQKFRNIGEMSPDKFGVSSFLAKKIYSALTLQDSISNKIGSDIIAFFKHTRAIEFYTLWEKVFTYFVVIKDKDGLLKVEENIKEAISATELKSGFFEGFDLQGTLTDILRTAIGMALSLNPHLYDEYKDISVKFLVSNMTRHKYVALPLMAYLKYNEKGKYSDLTYANYFQGKLPKFRYPNDLLRTNLFKFCPRYIPFHEVVIYNISFMLFSLGYLPIDYLQKSFTLFYKINYYTRLSNPDDSNHKEHLQSQYFVEKPLISEDGKSGLPKVNHLTLTSKEHPEELNIGIGNIELSENDIYHSLIDKPIANKRRKDRLFSIINQATKENNVDFLVLPEASVPCRWFDLISNKARTENIAFVFGLEHLIANGIAFNLIVNLLPIEISKNDSDIVYRAVVPIVRIKNHYSPSEIEEVEGHHHTIPKVNPIFYHLITWRNIYFTTFNCFELTNILTRSIFRSRIDVLFACEFNSDVNYFSNLVESSSRDLHCYVVQSNSSYYGDSRITQPTRTETKDILKIKGGKNPTVLIGQVSIKKLRKFQYLRWNLQLSNKVFKTTPPGFNRDLVAKRLGIKVKTKLQ